jgi:hypothetical protein
MKTKLKTQIAAVWAVALMLLSSITVYAAYTTINVDLVKQAKSNWCWAACLEMS